MSNYDFSDAVMLRGASAPATPEPPKQMVQHPSAKNQKLDFGIGFQSKALAMFLRIPSTLPNYFEVIRPQHFEDARHATMCSLIFEFFKEYKKAPGSDVLKDVVAKFCKRNNYESEERLRLNALVDTLVNTDISDGQYILDKMVDFAKLRFAEEAAVHLINQINVLRADGTASFEAISPMIRRLATVGMTGDIGYSIPENVDDLPDQLRAEGVYSATKKCPTAYPTLDKTLGGGLAPGEFGFAAAPPGVGKSTQLIQFGAAALRAGFNVMIYSMELQQYDYALRIAQRLTGVSKEHVEERSMRYNDRVNYLKGVMAGRQCLVKCFPPRIATVDMLKSHFSNVLASRGEDGSQWLVLIDYADLLKLSGTKNSQTWEMIGNVIYELIGMAREFRVPMWTVSQINREGTKKVKGTGGGKLKRLSTTDLAGAFEKANAADVILMFTQTDFEKAIGQARCHIAKARRGKDGISFKVQDHRPIMSMIELDKEDNPVFEYRPKRNGEPIQFHYPWDNSSPYEDEKLGFLKPPQDEIEEYLRDQAVGLQEEERGISLDDVVRRNNLQPDFSHTHDEEPITIDNPPKGA